MEGAHRSIRMRLLAGLAMIMLLGACATAWQERGAYFRSVPTPVTLDSTPPAARVFLNNRYLGDTPLSVAVECEEETKKKTRRVSYWVTQPGWSLLLSLVSLGVYIPFSVIPVDTETSLEPTGVFKDNPHVLRIEADGYKSWSGNVVCGTQAPVPVRAVLKKS